MRHLILSLALVTLILSALPATRAQEELTESFTTENGVLSIRYPAGWTVGENSGLVVGANFSFDPRDATLGNNLSDDQTLFIAYDPIFINPGPEDVDIKGMGGEEAITALRNNLAKVDSLVTLGPPIKDTIDGVDIYFVTFIDQEVGSILILVPDGNESYVAYLAFGTPEAFEQFIPTHLVIAASVIYRTGQKYYDELSRG